MFGHAGITLEIALDELRRRGALDAERVARPNAPMP
jgi:hypothetical protein